MVKTYKLYSTATATTDAVANILVTRKCKVLSVNFAILATAGAATTGVGAAQLSTQSTNSFFVHDTLNDFAHATVNGNIASAGMSVNSNVLVSGKELEESTRVYLHIYWAGQAPASAVWLVTMYVQV